MDTPSNSCAAAVPAGRMPEVDSATRSWWSWNGKMQFFFVAYDVDAPNKEKAHI